MKLSQKYCMRWVFDDIKDQYWQIKGHTKHTINAIGFKYISGDSICDWWRTTKLVDYLVY